MFKCLKRAKLITFSTLNIVISTFQFFVLYKIYNKTALHLKFGAIFLMNGVCYVAKLAELCTGQAGADL